MKDINRRSFLKGSLAASAGVAALSSREEEILVAQLAQDSAAAATAAAAPVANALPTGKIGDVEFSRVICGGNLIGGWAHSRDLMYVSRLLKAYNTDEKIMDTLELCEQHGINAILTNPVSGDVIKRYWRERGGKIQWICECHPTSENVEGGIREAVDNGAAAVYIQGAKGDRLVKDARLDLIANTMSLIKDNMVPAGVGAHSLDVPVACEKAGIATDFYVKTLHTKDYWSAQRENQTQDVISNPSDNYWCISPEETVAFMETVEKPWIAFKVLAAGAIPPSKGFRYAFESGADFICVGMFDFQIAEDAKIAREVLAKVQRKRPWRA